MQVLRYEPLQTEERSLFVAKVQVQKWRSQRVQALPVHVLRVRCNPRLQQATQLPVPLWRGQQLIVLVAARNVHLDLAIGGRRRLLVDGRVPAAARLQHAQQAGPHMAAQQRRHVALCLGGNLIARVRIAEQQALEQDDAMELVLGVALANDKRQGVHCLAEAVRL